LCFAFYFHKESTNSGDEGEVALRIPKHVHVDTKNKEYNSLLNPQHRHHQTTRCEPRCPWRI